MNTNIQTLVKPIYQTNRKLTDYEGGIEIWCQYTSLVHLWNNQWVITVNGKIASPSLTILIFKLNPYVKKLNGNILCPSVNVMN